MLKRTLIFFAGCSVFLLPAALNAQGPWGEIRAEPNPCRIEPGREECTARIIWHTRGVERAKVFVTSMGTEIKEQEYVEARNCEGDRCLAPWIKHNVTYTFNLFDFTRGDRGRLLASVVVTGVR
jgi:hypothetical protein